MRTLPLLLLLSGCSWLVPTTLCETSAATLVDGADPLACAAVEPGVTYVEVLAGRSLKRGDRNLVLKDLAARHQADPMALQQDLKAMRAKTRAMARLTGLDAAAARSRAAWEALHGEGVLTAGAYPNAHRVVVRQVASRASDDTQKLVFTEMDIEGWISFASLCREVQGGGPLKLSISQREKLYADLVQRFEAADPDTRRAMVGIGPFWRTFTRTWKAASYEEQQAWIQQAQMPPPMTASSMGYAEAVFDEPMTPQVNAWHRAMGPFRLSHLGD